MNDTAKIKEKWSGKVCTTQNGNPIIWNGHLCEGAAVVPTDFILWTRCGSADVPTNSAYEGSKDDVSCEQCLTLLQSAWGKFTVEELQQKVKGLREKSDALRGTERSGEQSEFYAPLIHEIQQEINRRLANQSEDHASALNEEGYRRFS